jgi:hypothetical protein
MKTLHFLMIFCDLGIALRNFAKFSCKIPQNNFYEILRNSAKFLKNNFYFHIDCVFR